MFDRALIIVLILFLTVGAYSYEKYCQERGDVGPVARLIDFAKFGKTSDVFHSSFSHKVFKYNARATLAMLREKHNSLESQRVQLVLNRRELLSQLDKISDEIVNEALGYAHRIDEDREQYLDRFPEIAEIGQNIIQTTGISNPREREERYQVIRTRLEDILQELGQSQAENRVRFNQILDEMDHIVNQEEAFLSSCPDWGDCVNERLRRLRGEARALSEEILGDAQKDIKVLAKMTEELREQYKALGENLEVNDEQIEANNELMAGKLKLLAEHLVSVTETDLKSVMDAYEDLETQQEILLENLDLHQARVRQTQEDNNRRSEEIMANLKQVPRIDFSKLETVTRSAGTERSEVFFKFEENEVKLKRIVRDRLSDNGNLLVEMARNAPIDGSKLMEDRKYAERRAANSRLDLLSSGSHNLDSFERNNDLKTGLGRSLSNHSREPLKIEPLRPRSSLNNRKQEEASEQFKRLKTKARDNGF